MDGVPGPVFVNDFQKSLVRLTQSCRSFRNRRARRVRAIEVAKGEEQIKLASAAWGVPPDY
jgi:hypothetical protein